MCWISNYGAKPTPQIATKDMVVWKTLLPEFPKVELTRKFPWISIKGRRARSIIRGYTYTLGNLQEEVPLKCDLTLRTGFRLWEISEGYHSWKQRPAKESLRGFQRRYLCIIPEGTEYYINSMGDIVSSTIKIIEYGHKAKKLARILQER